MLFVCVQLGFWCFLVQLEVGADKEKARSVVFLSVMEVSFRYNQGDTVRRAETWMGWNTVKNEYRQIRWGFIMDTFESKGEKFIFNPSLDR